jgi:hypothetical protein
MVLKLDITRLAILFACAYIYYQRLSEKWIVLVEKELYLVERLFGKNIAT